jgi:DNA-binding transcriptional ArsR family regulator
MVGMSSSRRSQNTLRVERAAPVFAALGDPTRLRLVERLGIGGPASITKLTRGSRVTRQAITKHLRVLETVGLVRASRHGREQRWELDGDELAAVQHQLSVVAAHWDRALQRLRAMVENG